MKIGVYDSGVGGITVLAELRQRFPEADYVYLGDTANLPYGTKSAAQIERLSRDCARHLKSMNIDALVVACNTASAHALDVIREELKGIPVMGVLKPGVEAVLKALPSAGEDMDTLTVPILVLATSATVRSEAYGRTIRNLLQADMPGRLPLPIIEQACPLLVPMIEEGWIDHPILKQTLQEYVGMHVRTYGAGIALLGCTHYPWIQSAIEKALPGWKVINSAETIVDSLEREGIKRPAAKGTAPSSGGSGSSKVQWVFTDPLAVPAFARKWMEALSE
jgi:glutamate racemase